MVEASRTDVGDMQHLFTAAWLILIFHKKLFFVNKQMNRNKYEILYCLHRVQKLTFVFLSERKKHLTYGRNLDLREYMYMQSNPTAQCTCHTVVYDRANLFTVCA